MQFGGVMTLFKLKTVLLILGFSLLCCVPPAAAAELRGRVDWIYDGDTLSVDGIGKIRLIGIDTPETDASSRDATYRRSGISLRALRSGATNAKNFMIRTAKGKDVTLKFDRERVDRYGRTLAYVTLADGRMLNRELLREGLALVYQRFDFQWKDDFLTVEADARRAGRGLWAHE